MSEHGLSFVSGHECQPGDEITVAFRLEPTEPPLQLRSIVRYVSDKQTGVEFRSITLAERLRISRFLTTRAAATTTQ